MPRKLDFHFRRQTFNCALNKVDRNRLYGSRRIETLDMDDKPCSLATLLDDGRTLVPVGGTASGYINPDGEWVRRKEITPTDLEGNPLPKVASSFDTGLTLDQTTDVEDFLDHGIRLCYALEGEIPEALLESLAAGVIYKTPFSYRGGINPDPAFVMQGADDTIWLLIGEPNAIDYATLEQAAVVAATREEDEEDESDELDFGML